MLPVAVPSSPAARDQRLEELGRIIMAYSEVTEKLQASHDQLTATVARLQQELGDKNRELERRNRLAALGEMAAGLAHEIRNPLGGIQLYASLLAKDLADRADQQKLVLKIRDGVKRLEALVSQVLHFSREIVAHPHPCDVAQVVRDAVDLAHGRVLNAAEASDAVRLVCHAPETLTATVDETLIGQAVLNLVLNAVEAVGAGGTVFVTLSDCDDRRFALTVRDTGPGIPADVIDRIFNPFFTTKDEGTGLGLSIVHRVIEAHNGVITARNHPDGGAVFEVRI